MSIEPNDPLEQSLRGLNWWPEAAPGLWKKSLRKAERGGFGARAGLLVGRVLRSRWPWVASPIAAVIALAVLMGPHSRLHRRVVTAPSESERVRFDLRPPASSDRPGHVGDLWDRVRAGGSTPASFVSPSSDDRKSNEDNPQEFWRFDADGDGQLDSAGPSQYPQAYFKMLAGGRPVLTPKQFISPSAQAGVVHSGEVRYGDEVLNGDSIPAGSAPASGERHVVRKVAIDVQVEDVRGVYLKVQTMLPNEAVGEFVEQAQIHDTGGQLSAYAVVRVRAEHVSGILDTLRGLGAVLREQNDASDVTAQVVDIEARLRNERRVEQELIALLDKRKDAPLDEVLKVSNSLAEVRGRIESLVGDQQRIARQVALATIMVTLQPKPKTEAPPPPAETGFRFRERVGAAWAEGLSFLIDSLTAILRVIVGGLVWWVLLVAGLVVLRRWYLRRTAA